MKDGRNSMHKFEHWVIACLVLAALAAFFKFCFRGYTYISATLLFIAALIVVFHLGSEPVKRIVAILTCIGLIYFCAVEYLIVSNARTDQDPERSYLIVLGAAVHGDRPSLSLYHRLTSALEYLEQYPNSKAVLSGGQGNGGRPLHFHHGKPDVFHGKAEREWWYTGRCCYSFQQLSPLSSQRNGSFSRNGAGRRLLCPGLSDLYSWYVYP